jgi:hypothetical protein
MSVAGLHAALKDDSLVKYFDGDDPKKRWIYYGRSGIQYPVRWQSASGVYARRLEAFIWSE